MNYRPMYNVQKGSAKRRGISWEMTYEEWLKIWQESGFLGKRGAGNGRYVMARNGDRGPYKVGNVRIILALENTLEYWAGRKYAAGPRRLSGRKPAMINFADGRIDMMDPLEILENLEQGLDGAF